MVSKTLIKTFPHLTRACDEVCKSPVIAIDYETEDLTGESNGLDLVTADVIGIAFSVPEHAYYVDVNTLTYGDVDLIASMWLLLSDTILDTREHYLVSHNTRFELHHTKRALDMYNIPHKDILVPGKWWDTMAMAVLNNENLVGVQILLPDEDDPTFERRVGALSLKALSRVMLGRYQRLWDDQFSDWSLEERVDYACDDVINCLDLAILLAGELREKGLMGYCEEVLLPQVFVSQSMEQYGFMFNVEAARAAEHKIEGEITELETKVVSLVPGATVYKYTPSKPWTRKEITSIGMIGGWDWPKLTPSGNPSITAKILAGLATKYPEEVVLNTDDARRLGVSLFSWDQIREEIKVPFNSRSNAQLGTYLRSVGVRLPLTATGQVSVSEGSLREGKRSKPELPIWGPLFTLRKLQKLKSTYITGILNVVWPEDNTLHPQWNFLGTVSGRYTCTKARGNKQLTHKRGPAGQTFPNPDRMEDSVKQYNPRQWIIPRPGYKYVIGDLSQAEVKMLAVLSQDRTLTRSIQLGADLHAANAEALYGDSWREADEVDRKEMRTRAKTATFAVIYGAGAGTLSLQLKIPEEQSKDLLEAFYKTFSGILDFKDETILTLKKQGYVTSWLGRRRSPILMQRAPRVTANPKYRPKEYKAQELNARLWTTAFDVALKKSRFDPEQVTRRELEGRAERQAINFMVQGSVGDMINVGAARLMAIGHRIVIQMHDEIVLEVPDNEKALATAVADMHEVFEIEIEGIPFTLDTVVGDSWNAGKEGK